MPLYVTDGKLQLGEPGKLAAQRSCCCNEEGDDPAACFCPDLCLYQVSMNDVAASGGPCECQIGSVVVGGTVIYAANCTGVLNGLVSKGGTQVVSWPVLTYPGIFSIGPGTIAATFSASVRIIIVCTGEKLVAYTSWVASCLTGGGVFQAKRSASKTAAFELPYLCSKKSKANCAGYEDGNRANYLATPIEITISESSPGIGSWTEEGSEREGLLCTGDFGGCIPDENVAGILDDLFESLRTITGTFRITQRDSCQLTGCPCTKRGVGHTLYAVEETGTELCCPPGTTVLPGEGLCECQPNDPQCTQGLDGGWYVSPQSSEGWQDCGDVCVRFDEDCPP